MPFSTPSERYKWMNLKTHRSWQEMTVAVGHTDGRSLTLRANQAKPQVAKGSTGGARWGVNGHFKLLTGSHYVGHDGHKVGRRHLVARVQVCEPFTRELIFKTCCDLFQEKLMEEVKLFNRITWQTQRHFTSGWRDDQSLTWWNGRFKSLYWGFTWSSRFLFYLWRWESPP